MRLGKTYSSILLVVTLGFFCVNTYAAGPGVCVLPNENPIQVRKKVPLSPDIVPNCESRELERPLAPELTGLPTPISYKEYVCRSSSIKQEVAQACMRKRWELATVCEKRSSAEVKCIPRIGIMAEPETHTSSGRCVERHSASGSSKNFIECTATCDFSCLTELIPPQQTGGKKLTSAIPTGSTPPLLPQGSDGDFVFGD